MNSDARNVRLRVTRRGEPDLARLVEWVLGIAEERHRFWVAGEPDPYGLALPDGIATELDHRVVWTVPENFRDRQPTKAAAPHGITVVDIFHHRHQITLRSADDLSHIEEGPRKGHHEQHSHH